MIFEAFIIGISAGLIKDGRLSNFSRIDFRGFALVLIGALCQFVPFFLNDIPVIVNYFNYVVFIGLLCILLFLGWNHKISGFRVMLFGFLLNLTAYVTNGFKMPIYISRISQDGLANLKFSIEVGEINNYILFEQANPIFRYLGKFAVMPDWYPFGKYFGAGDVIIAVGVIYFIVRHMMLHKRSSFARKTYR